MRIKLVLAVLALSPAIAAAVAPPRVRLEWIVHAPDVSTDGTIDLSGNLAELGNWRGDGLRLERSPDGVYRGHLVVPRGTKIEYKVTRGSWASVEKGPRGEEIANRTLVADKDQRIDIEVAGWASGAAASQTAARHTLTGDIRTHERFRSRLLNNERTIVVYCPPGYRDKPDKRYPVLYMHDGQNVFDAATSFLGIEWQADETAERLIKAGRIEPIIIVGIYNTPARMDEYTPWPDTARKAGGRGDLYTRFVIEEVKPFIDHEYRTKPDRKNTAVAGSSLGGLISLHMGAHHADVFSRAGVISPAIVWNNSRILKDLESHADDLRRVRFWVDMGTAEGSTFQGRSPVVDSTRHLVALFDRAGLAPGRDYYYAEVFDGQHNEPAWAARFDKILLYFYAR